ncbi:hypothetical protein [Marinicellulosiphila megalodicopiae]|uniref:hypothetical protein n=1 Tax=Marinicellulosiphila megalodicopiae TaxID=2724896 RepID=UPI003BAEFD44
MNVFARLLPSLAVFSISPFASAELVAVSEEVTPAASKVIAPYEINFNPVNGIFGKQYMFNGLYAVTDDVAIGPMISFDRLDTVDTVDADTITEYALGVRLEKAPLGFKTDGYYSSVGLDIQGIKTKSETKNCRGNFLGYGGTFLAGYSFRENPSNIVTKLGAGLHTSMYIDAKIDCKDDTKLNIRDATDYVTFTFIVEASIGYSF